MLYLHEPSCLRFNQTCLATSQLISGSGAPNKRQYSEEIRKFSLTLNFFSPKAYEFVRSTYNTCLLHPRTLSKWYQHINSEPGFCSEAFDTLKAKVQSSNLPVGTMRIYVR